MRNIILVFTLIRICISADCQTFFNRYLEPVENLNPIIVDLVIDSDRLLIQTLHTENKSIISVTDRKGELDNHITYNGFGASYLGLERFNGEFVMWGEDKSNPKGLLLKFINDDLTETSTFGFLTERDWDFPVSFIVNQDNIYSLCVYIDSTTNLVHGVVKGIDDQGKEIWEKDIHEGEKFVNIYQIGVNKNDQIVVSSRFDDGPNDVVGVITYLSQSGSIRRQRKMSEEIEPGTRVTFVELSNGDIVCGTIVDRRQEWDFIQNEWFGLPTKYYLLAGSNLQEQKDTIYLSSKFERPGGEKLWKGNGDYFFIYGNVWYVLEDQTYGMLKKVDNDGNILWSRRYQHEDFTGSTNPATDLLTIEYLDVSKSYSYKIVDLIGKSLLSGMIIKRESAYIDVSSLRQGLYHISIFKEDKETEVIRFVVQ